LTTPDEPERAVMDGVSFLVAWAGGIAPARIVHGTTLITNAIVERKGAPTALLTTRGFRDVLEIRREGRYDLYDLDLEFPDPLVPRSRRFEAPERVDEQGRVIEPLDEADLARFLEHAPEGIASWAVCFLHAYANPEHERRAAEMLRDAFPHVPVSLSSEVAPEIREYERTSTVVANAYVRPTAETYLKKLAVGLSRLGDSPVLHVMLSDGGLIPPETAARHPIRIVESGPAGGVLAAERLRKSILLHDVLSLDMGGTTAKIAFLDDSGPKTRSLFEVDRRHLFKKGSGLPLLVPSLDLVEIGAGGGSLARKGPLGTLVVGPESAGAMPGPACYGRGGREATVTDADLVLGLLDADYFLGGMMHLDFEQAKRAIEEHVARPLGLEIMEAAAGIHRIVGSNMAEAARMHAAERGLDLTAHALVAFGGAGPVHAWSLARQLRIPRVVIPTHSGVESSVGFLAAPPAFETARSLTQPLEDLLASKAEQVLEEMADTARKELAGTGRGEIAIRAFVDMRYRGQGSEVRVPLASLRVEREPLAKAFVAAYAALYGRPVMGVPVEIVTWRVRAERPAPGVPLFQPLSIPEWNLPLVPARFRKAWLPDFDAPRDVPVFRREELVAGMIFEGPALIEERDTTIVLGRGEATVLSGGALILELES
ncbi:MAG TPA: hydantoinase/oxoprolinase family protein, partial [Candidatus Eisenbacteria bacterium]|nr:hydantoinase/oxoprolinase family protein [Candidatus Eisenbacteria bacterium]